MSVQWTASFVGEMHQHRIKQTELALELGMTPEYVCTVLSGKRNPKNAEHRFRSALNTLIEKKRSIS